MMSFDEWGLETSHHKCQSTREASFEDGVMQVLYQRVPDIPAKLKSTNWNWTLICQIKVPLNFPAIRYMLFVCVYVCMNVCINPHSECVIDEVDGIVNSCHRY